MDLDHFKVLNDTYGHPIGDQVLLEAAGLIATAIRASDIACRYGGDEIVVILPLTDSEETRCVAERLRNSFQQHVFCREVHDLRTTVSIGAASVLGGELSEQRILMLADRALYRAKQSGRDRVVCGDD